MDNGLIIVMTFAVVLSALALLAQALMVFGMFKAVRTLQERVTIFLPKAEQFLSTAQVALADTQKQVKEISTRALTVLDTTQSQLTRVDGFVGDATQRARVQMDRVELVLDDTVSRVHETVVQLNNGLLKPMRELNGLAAGVRAAVQHLARRGRPTVDQATADEEMFI